MRILALALLIGCSDSPHTPDGGAGGADAAACEQQAALEQAMRDALDAAATDPAITTVPDFTVLLETNAGRSFAHSHGASTATTVYESASTSKWVTAAVILDAVDRGMLALDTKANDLLPYWAETTVTLRDLLSFTSGFHDEPLCINAPNASFATCVEAIYTRNASNGIAAGSQFYYSSTHMQVAGQMTITASQAASWTAVFDAFKARTGLFGSAAYDLPSATNPRLAGGMHWTATDYQAFLRALVAGDVLSSASRAQLFANQRGAATVAYSPSLAATSIGEDWSYGLGNWLECPDAKTANSYDCGEGHRNSSAGAYGAYPFIDFDHRYFGIVARQGGLGTFPEGLRLFRSIEPLAVQWAAACP